MRRTPIVFLILLLGLTGILYGQKGPLVWKYANTGNYGNIKMMETDAVGNSYLVGTFDTDNFQYAGSPAVAGTAGAESVNTFILKVDQTGKPIWLRSIQGDISGSNVKPKKMNVSPRGELGLIITAHYCNSVKSGETSINMPDSTQETAILFKFSKGGNLSWAYPLLADAGSQQATANDLFVDEQGDVYSTGFFRGTIASLGGVNIDGLGTDGMMFVACIRADGEIGWFKNIPTDAGDNGDLVGTHIANTSGNFFYVAGTHYGYKGYYLGSDLLTSSNRINTFISRFNKDGSAVWGRLFVGDSTDYPEAIRVLPNNNLLLLGITPSYSLNLIGDTLINVSYAHNLFLVNFNENGDYVNSRGVNVANAYYNYSGRNAYLHTDAYGNCYVSSEFENNEIFVADGMVTNADYGTRDIFVAKLNSTSMIPYWVLHGTAPGDNYLEAVSVNTKGEVFLGGTSYNDYTIDGQPLPVNAAEGVPYLAKLNPDGTLDFLYYQNNDPDNQIRVNGISSDTYGNTYICGIFLGTTSTLDNISLTDPENQGIFMAKYAHTKLIRGDAHNQAGDAITKGYAKIFGYTLYQRSPINDSVQLSASGAFEFANIPHGEYIITVVPEGDIADQYIPTYYPASEYWEFAEQITIDDKTSDVFLHVIMQENSEFRGESKLVGNVQQEDLVKSLSKNFAKARPSRNTKVVVAGSKVIHKSTYEIIGYTETDDEGNFTFSNIEDGNYYVWADIPGLPCEPVYFVTITGGNWVSNLDYLVTEEIVEGTGSPVYDMLEASQDDPDFTIFPNPVANELTISSDEFRAGTIDLYNINGNHIKHEILDSQTQTIDLSAIPAGQYIIRIMTTEKIVFRKVTIRR